MEQTWLIEEAGCHNLPAMLEFWQGINGVGLGRSDEPAALSRVLQANPGTCLVASDQGHIVGTILGGFDGRRGMIYHLAVDPTWRHQGLGTALLERCLTVLRERGAWKVNLFVYVDNVQAITFYQHLGWQPRRDIQVLSWEYPVGSHSVKDNSHK